MAIGKTGIKNGSGRIARTRPPGRNQVAFAPLALEYDLQALADKDTQDKLVSVVNQIIGPGGPPTIVIYSLAMPGEFLVTGSPGTNGGAFVVAWDSETANFALRGPVSGSAAVPTFRKDINDDLPYRSKILIEPTTFGGTVTPDASLASQFSMVATSNFNLAAPVNAIDGQKITIRITQDGTGGRVMTLDPLYRFSTYLDSAFVVLSSLPGATDYLGVERNDDAGAFDIIAFVPGVS